MLSTTSFLGGKNAFLGAAYLAVGTSCALASAVFLYFHFKLPEKGRGHVGAVLAKR